MSDKLEDNPVFQVLGFIVIVAIVGYNIYACSYNNRIEDAEELFNRGDYEEAREIFIDFANDGDSNAQFNVGVCYYNEGNYSAAVNWFRKSAEQGNAHAQFNLGSCYAKGLGVSQSYTEAVKWYRKAAEQGDAAYAIGQGGVADAMHNLGCCYAMGLGVSRDLEKAKDWLCRATLRGHPQSRELYNSINDLEQYEDDLDISIEDFAPIY